MGWMLVGVHSVGAVESDEFWSARLPPSRKGTRWVNVLKTLVCYQLLDPGSEWRLHRQWYERSALGDLLGEDLGLVQSNKLYRCLDKLLAHKASLFSFLHRRWQVLFDARFDVLLYDLTSTYFESAPPDSGKRRHGYSRDKRPDCVQVVSLRQIEPPTISAGLRLGTRLRQSCALSSSLGTPSAC